MNTRSVFSLIMLCLFPCAICSVKTARAEIYDEKRIYIEGRAEATITGSKLTLGHVAQVRGRSLSDDDAVIALERIQLGPLRNQGESITLSAQELVAQLRAEGVDLNAVGYRFPRIVRITRASRSLNEGEVRNAIAQFFASSGREAEIRAVQFPREIQLPTGDVAFNLEPLVKNRPGAQDFVLTALSSDGGSSRFTVSANMDEYGNVPVASRSLNRGAVVGPEDVMLARVNLAALPRDVAAEAVSVVGQRTNQQVPAGAVFRVASLEVAPLIEAGTQVTLLYRSGPLEASATGVALESARAGGILRVRNESSKKIVQGIARDQNLVEVQS